MLRILRLKGSRGDAETDHVRGRRSARQPESRSRRRPSPAFMRKRGGLPAVACRASDQVRLREKGERES